MFAWVDFAGTCFDRAPSIFLLGTSKSGIFKGNRQEVDQLLKGQSSDPCVTQVPLFSGKDRAS